MSLSLLSGAPLASRAELFVAGPEPGTALRVGEPGSATAALEKKAAAAGAALVAGEPIPIALSRTSHVATLREALYAHALATMGDEFEVSRDGARGVILTAKPGTPRCDATLENGRGRVAARYAPRSPRCRRRRALRRARVCATGRWRRRAHA